MTVATADTIVALATPPGVGGIAIIRMSGPLSAAILQALYTNADQCVRQPQRLVFGKIRHNKQFIDEGLAVWMPAPHSYTGEDVVEIHSHGSQLIVQKIVQAATELGARLAEPGEFTRRAYLNNKLDLVQAEAVSDVINAESEAALQLAQGQLGGAWSAKVHELEQQVVDFMAQIAAELDFGDEDIPELSVEQQLSRVQHIKKQIAAWLQGVAAAEVIRDGYRVALIGLPNAGKSSLLNALAGYERAIVTDQPGTTRDTVDHRLMLEGIMIELVDTAGLRTTNHEVERLGIERSRQTVSGCQAALVLLAADQDVAKLKAQLAEFDSSTQKILGVQTKIDILPEPIDWGELGIDQTAAISAKTKLGLPMLSSALSDLAQQSTRGNAVTANARHVAALTNADRELQQAYKAIQNKLPLDAVATHLQAAARELAGITGTTVSQATVDSIFRNFCIGK